MRSESKYIEAGELYHLFSEFENNLKNNLNKVLSLINIDFLSLKNKREEGMISIDYFEFLEEQAGEFFEYGVQHFSNREEFSVQGLMQELELEKSIRGNDDVSKLTLGFYIQIFKWENVIRICKEVSKKTKTRFHEYHFLDLIFLEWRNTNTDYLLKTNKLYEELTEIQGYRNDFCHFRLKPEDFAKIRQILIEYTSILKKH
jgi:hypothetical protein